MPMSKEGVSVEKCIAVINVLRQAGLAANPPGEAAENYQSGLTDLESLCNSLYDLQSLQHTDSRIKYSKAINAQSTLQSTFLDDILTKAEHYGRKFEALSPLGRVRSPGSVLDWSKHVSKEVAQRRELVDAQNNIINLVIQLIAIASAVGNQEYSAKHEEIVSDVPSRHKTLIIRDDIAAREVQNKVTELIAAINNFRDDSMQHGLRTSRKGSISRDSSKVTSTASTDILIKSNPKSRRPRDGATNPLIMKSVDIMVGRILQNQLFSNPQARFESASLEHAINRDTHKTIVDEPDTAASFSGTSSDISTKDSHKGVAYTSVALPLNQGPRTSQPSYSQQIIVTPSRLALPSIDVPEVISQADVKSIWNSLVELVSQMAYQFVVESLWKLLCLFPAIMILIRRKLSSIAATPTSILQDDIRFEDFLGRKYSLPYEYFKEWSIFRAMLISRFQDFPGSNQVVRGRFRILGTAIQERIFDETNWHRTVFPGASLAMAILIKRRKFAKGMCLQNGCGGRTSMTTDHREICDKCGLEFHHDFTPLTRPLIEPVQEVTKLRSDPLFKQRLPSRQLNHRNPLYEPPKTAQISRKSLSGAGAAKRDGPAMTKTRATRNTNAKVTAVPDLPVPGSEDSDESQDEDLSLFRRIRVMTAAPVPRLLSPMTDLNYTSSYGLQSESVSRIIDCPIERQKNESQEQSSVGNDTTTELPDVVQERQSRQESLAMNDNGRSNIGDSDKNRYSTKARFRSSSQDQSNHPSTIIFIADIDRAIRDLLKQEDTDADYKITIDDQGPKEISLGTVNISGHRPVTLRGTYAISTLLQELTLAQETRKNDAQIDRAILYQNPIERLQLYITSIYWRNLTCTYSQDIMFRLWLLGQGQRDGVPQLRLYIPRAAKEQYSGFMARVQEDDSELDVHWLPTLDDVSPSTLITQPPGILALATQPKRALATSSGVGRLIDSLPELEPYISPHRSDVALAGWHSYFAVLGLLTANKNIDLARSIVNNLCFCICNYGKVVHTNHLHSIGRSQPPFLTDMILQVFDRIKHEPSSHDWLRSSTLAAIKEYYMVWTADPRYDHATGLSKYSDDNKSIVADDLRPELRQLISDRATSYRLELQDFINAYNEKEMDEPDIEDYILQTGAEIESGHFPSERFGGRAADLVTIDLNSLLYKYEVDIGNIIRTHFDGHLEIPEEYRIRRTGQDVTETFPVWERRAKMRKSRIDQYLWDSKQGLYYDYDIVKKRRTQKASATMFWALWAGVSSPRQAAELVIKALPQLEAHGGLLATSGSSNQEPEWDLHSKLPPFLRSLPVGWNSPFGFAPHQVLAWTGLMRYGYSEESERLVYRWLHTITSVFAEYNGTVVDKYYVTGRRDAHRGEDAIGNDFKCVNLYGHAWTNASVLVGLSLLPTHMRRALGALVPWESFEKATKMSLDDSEEASDESDAESVSPPPARFPFRTRRRRESGYGSE